MTEHNDEVTLRQMLDHAREAHALVSGLDQQAFLADRIRYLAATRLISIVGEAATRISSERREQLPQIPWRQIIGFRNVLIHLYHRIEDAVLWQVLTSDLPALVNELDQLELPEVAE